MNKITKELTVVKSPEEQAAAIMARVKIVDRDGELWTDSLSVADVFGKNHRDVLVVIRKIDEENQRVNLRSFTRIKYCDSRGREQDAFEMTEAGFFAVVARFNNQRDIDIGLIRSGYFKAATSSDISSDNSIASDSEIEDEFNRILHRLSESSISVHLSGSLASMRKMEPDDFSIAKATSSFSTKSNMSDFILHLPSNLFSSLYFVEVSKPI